MKENTAPILTCRGLARHLGDAAAGFELRVPALTLAPGEVVVLQAPSGSGKSTLLDLLALILRPDAAEVLLLRRRSGEIVDCAASWRLQRHGDLDQARRSTMGYVLQSGGLLSFISARENIALACRLAGVDPSVAVDPLAERLGISRLLDKPPTALSMGERQRVAIARALAPGPALLLADEPTAALDPITGRAVMTLLTETIAVAGASAVIATHDPQLTAGLGARVACHGLDRVGAVTRATFAD